MPANRPPARHAAPGGFSARRAAALPCLLLTAAGGAFAGLALLPTPPESDQPRVTAAQALAPAEVAAPADVNKRLATALEQGYKAALAQPPASAADAARASRSRELPAPPADPGGSFARPGAGRLTSAYGRRWGRLHAGIDLAAGMGSPVRAAAAGVVVSGGWESGYGQVVRVRHADGTQTVYAHMSAVLVDGGDRVRAGALVGREGNTGRSTGPHLHFEVRVNGTPVNPLTWLDKRGIDI